ncbi:exodeoxyribonuclease I [Aurantivibrio infirmus]
MNTLYWHDYETWGEVPNLDKPSQFAGVRTNEELEIVGDPLSIYCQPASDCLPKPEACLVTGITPQHALKHGLPDYEFMAKIHRELSRPGTCGVGYNSIRFDDEVTRNGLFRNFYDPYEREWRNGNSRWDIIDVVRLTYALRPEGIEWPRHEDGSPSFRLEELSKANKLVHESAHDALSDVYATIALAKLVKNKQPGLYDYAYKLRDKKNVADLIDLSSRKPLLHISSRYPASQACAALVVPLAMHPENKNGVIVYDLSASPSLLSDLSVEEISERLFTRREDLDEGVERVPLKVVHLNKSPILTTPKLVDAKIAERIKLDKNICEKHWQEIKDLDLTEKLHAVFSSNQFSESNDPEQSLYQGFLDNRDKKTMMDVRAASAKTLANTTFSFYDKRLPELLFRYRARNFPDSLSEQEKLQWREYLKIRFNDSDGATGQSVKVFREKIESLLNDGTLSAEKKEVLKELLSYQESLTRNIL